MILNDAVQQEHPHVFYDYWYAGKTRSHFKHEWIFDCVQDFSPMCPGLNLGFVSDRLPIQNEENPPRRYVHVEFTGRASVS